MVEVLLVMYVVKKVALKEKKEWRRLTEQIGGAKTLKWETVCVFSN